MSHELNEIDRKTLDDAKAMSGSKSLEFGCDWRKQYRQDNPTKADCDWAAWSGLVGWQLFLVADLVERLVDTRNWLTVDYLRRASDRNNALTERIEYLESELERLKNSENNAKFDPSKVW